MLLSPGVFFVALSQCVCGLTFAVRTRGSLQDMITSLEGGADVDQLDRFGRTALQKVAGKSAEEEKVRELVGRGASVTKPDAMDLYRTPLHVGRELLTRVLRLISDLCVFPL